MKRCSRCVLPETFPGISFDDEGVCAFCRGFRGHEHLDRSIEKYRARFEKLLAERRRKGGYDCLMAYSGGKDSTYTLAVLKETYDLSILALTIDNGFISPRSLENIHNVVEGLGIDLIIYKPRFDILRKIFSEAKKSEMYAPKTLERASTICTSCMGIVKFIALRMAIEGDIPFIMYGWSPGQAPIAASIFRNNPSMIRSMQKALFDPMRTAGGEGVENYFLTEEHFAMEDRFPHNISPLAFLRYDEVRIHEKIRGLGWEKPKDTDPNSTNCLLNAFANKIHIDRFGYNPYAFELAKLVREGYMERREAIERLEKAQDADMVAYVEKRLEKK
jgi:tRNA(Ile)-lysidine synthase TilS/MesJ